MSNDFKDNGIIPSKFTCDGDDISPHLFWENIPNGVKSFALYVTDPDALGGWIHWQVYDISKETKEIKQNSLPPEAKEVENDFSKKNYGGPCPPSGTHRYVFTLFALNVDHLESVSKH
ncbi:YbhB/YbcL family Raf kinase inhibitor-like protein, partial [Candidatus Bathyarchaeota archaeon]|nr:YbhB/YbcL family Raf kinase inhibitor-like protein [Candidatus Bathyarchaeota archaeon]